MKNISLEDYQAADELVSEIKKYIPYNDIPLLQNLDNLSDTVLDHLAYQYHVDFYKTDYPIQRKRQMIKDSFYLHSIKGTPYAVELFLSNFMKSPEVQEYFDYDGEPYHFKINTKGLFIPIDSEKLFLTLINHAKNVRSWLESITFDLTIEEAQKISVGHVYNFGGKVFTDIKALQGESINLKHKLQIISAGYELTGLAEIFLCAGEIYSYLQEKSAGYSLTHADIEFDDKWLWKYLLLEKWKDLNRNPVIEIYHHRDHGEEKIFVEDVAEYYFGAAEIYSGKEQVEVTFQTFDLPTTKFYAAQSLSDAGFEKVDADYQADDLTKYKQLILAKWKDLNHNPVVEFYHHRNHGEEQFASDGVLKNYFVGVEKIGGFEVTQADFTYWDDEPLPEGEEFLRLYFECGTGFRNLTLYNPKPNLTTQEIKSTGNYIVDNEVLQDSNGYLAERLIRAKLFYKEVENINL